MADTDNKKSSEENSAEPEKSKETEQPVKVETTEEVFVASTPDAEEKIEAAKENPEENAPVVVVGEDERSGSIEKDDAEAENVAASEAVERINEKISVGDALKAQEETIAEQKANEAAAEADIAEAAGLDQAALLEDQIASNAVVNGEFPADERTLEAAEDDRASSEEWFWIILFIIAVLVIGIVAWVVTTAVDEDEAAANANANAIITYGENENSESDMNSNSNSNDGNNYYY
ncbi:MAG: hypothetical protein LUB61_06580, partial [Eggerthellaceae bacterium]|nr:hypothetical protein [Eggerthellaceae bacterium]